MSEKEPNNISCLKCEYYHITWQSGHRHGCKLFGFKSKQLPSDAVYESSGMPCHGFKEKAGRGRKSSDDLSDGIPPHSTFEFRA